MAVRARLTAPREARFDWPYHTLKAESVRATSLFRGDRRMEAEAFLASGYGTRTAIESNGSGWVRLGDMANVWQPPRLAGTQVAARNGTPFLTATQVFDLRPVPRKWLSLDHTAHARQRFVDPGTILLTCSGSVGRATLARKSLDGILISHDLLRVEPMRGDSWGWLYAYLRAPSVIRLMQASHYGHIIKHLEVSHLNDVPVVGVEERRELEFKTKAEEILDDRNRAEALLESAHERISRGFGFPNGRAEQAGAGPEASHAPHSTARSSDLARGRRRLEGSYHATTVQSVLRNLRRHALGLPRLGDLAKRVWWMTRFSREFGEGGVPYMSADDLFSISQIGTKRVYTDPIPNHQDFFVKEGWILMACSGQVYGLNGSVVLATKHDEGCFFSHDLIRIEPGDEIPPGYPYSFLGHREIGRVLLERVAYGSSVPHIDPGDVEDVPIGRLGSKEEHEIAELAEEASRLNARAAARERRIGAEAEQILEAFLTTNRLA